MDTAAVEFEEFLSRSVRQLVTSVGWRIRMGQFCACQHASLESHLVKGRARSGARCLACCLVSRFFRVDTDVWQPSAARPGGHRWRDAQTMAAAFGA